MPINVTVQPQIRVVAITGPNTGGKTVTLKTLGLAVLMAKVGLFIPAREPVELPWFEQVLADIGDEQSIEQNLSTFSGHIRRITRILGAIAGVEGQNSASVGPDLEINPGISDVDSQAPRREPETFDLELESSVPIEPFDFELESELDPESELEFNSELNPELNPQTPTTTLDETLVLLDEVGAGTDPTEGSALAIALLQHLAEVTRLTVATTHFGELKALKYQDERFENASVEFDEASLQPTYRLLWGIPGRSNALTIAQRLGLSSEIIAQATEYVGGASQDVNQVIAGLEAQRQKQEERAIAASQLLQETERLHRELSQKAASLKEREQDLKQAQEQAVQEALREAKKEIAQVIRRLQQGEPKAQDAQMATTALDQIAQQHLPSQKTPKPKPGFQPQIGDRIRIPSIGQTAEVLTNPDEAGQLMVRFGVMKMNVGLAEIESLDGQKPELPGDRKKNDLKANTSGRTSEKHSEKHSTANQPPPQPLVQTSKNTLDLRGKRISEAEIDLDRMLSQVMDFGAVWIIHGKGTGQLRRGVQEFLSQHPQVERFELATQAEGGSGVTIAYLK